MKNFEYVRFLEQKVNFYENLPFENGDTLLKYAYQLDFSEALKKVVSFGLCERYEAGKTLAKCYDEAGCFLDYSLTVDPCALVYLAAFNKLAQKFPIIESFLSVDLAGAYSDFLVDFKKTTEHAIFLKQLKEWAETVNTAEQESLSGILREILECLDVESSFFESLFEG